MEPKEENETIKLVNLLENINNYRIQKKENFDFYDKNLIKDYASLATIDSIKKNPKYCLNK